MRFLVEGIVGRPMAQLRTLLGLSGDTSDHPQVKDSEGLISVREVRATIGACLGEWMSVGLADVQGWRPRGPL